jgi:hypothetical protein
MFFNGYGSRSHTIPGDRARVGKRTLYVFTIIIEFEGTTSVSQFSARNVGEAYQSWFQGLRDPYRFGLSADQGERLTSALMFEGLQPPTPLASTENVWCTTTLVGKNLALLNFVATANCDPQSHGDG